MVDPSYEIKDEYRSVPTAVAKALQTWPKASRGFVAPVVACRRVCLLG